MRAKGRMVEVMPTLRVQWTKLCLTRYASISWDDLHYWVTVKHMEKITIPPCACMPFWCLGQSLVCLILPSYITKLLSCFCIRWCLLIFSDIENLGIFKFDNSYQLGHLLVRAFLALLSLSNIRLLLNPTILSPMCYMVNGRIIILVGKLGSLSEFS